MSLKAAASSPTSSFDSTGTLVSRLPVLISLTALTNPPITLAVGSGRGVCHEDGHAHREDHQPGKQVEVVLRKEHEHGDEPDVGEGEHRYEGRYDDEPASDRARPGRQSELRDGHAEPDGDPARQEEEQGQYDEIAGGRIEQNGP